MIEKGKVNEITDGISKFTMLNYHVLEGMADWVRVVDKNGIVLYANKVMKDELGEDIVGQKCYEALGKNKPCSLCITNRSIETGETVQKEEKVGDRIFSAKSSPVTDFDGNIYAAVEVFRDVTRERKLEKELKEKNKKMSKDLNFAKTLQQKILPRNGIYKNISVDYMYKPSEMLSGDMFDVFYIDDTHVGIYISDVAGHGITASMMTMFVRQTMRAIKDDILSPSKALTELHKRFFALNLDDDKYFTIFYGVINCTTNELVYSNAGHNCIPILFNDDKLELLEIKGYPISYIFEEIFYEESSIYLKKGDKVLFYTDGITEVKNRARQEFGVQGVLDVIKKSKKNLIKDIENKVSYYKWGEQEDDFAVVLMEVIK